MISNFQLDESGKLYYHVAYLHDRYLYEPCSTVFIYHELKTIMEELQWQKEVDSQVVCLEI